MKSTPRSERPRSGAMLAVDTNVVVRYVVGDGGVQFAKAVDILENNKVSIALTVVLEVEWVLRDAYEFTRAEVLSALEKLSGLPTVTLAQAGIVRKAMALAARGLDFADALHVAQSEECAAFVTLDKQPIRKAKSSIDGVVRLA
jgi:predicted nucleic-acid-binding protein